MAQHGRMENWTAVLFLGLAVIGALGAAARRR
jgi:MYXO-CTERM domain-containing protein